MRKQVLTGTLLTVECAVFVSLIALLHLVDRNGGRAGLIVEICLLIPAFLVAVYFTIQRSMNQQEKTIAALNNELDMERKASRSTQVQFEEAIEKRIFELQVVNGALNREIAERIQAEGEVRDLQKQLNLILDCAGEGILGLDNSGKVIFMNRAASLMLGWEVEEMLGNTHHELIHHTYPDGTSHPVETCPIYMAYRDGLVHYKTGDIFWCKNGSSFPVEYVSTPIRDSGMLTGAVVVFRDMNTFK